MMGKGPEENILTISPWTWHVGKGVNSPVGHSSLSTITDNQAGPPCVEPRGFLKAVQPPEGPQGPALCAKLISLYQ